MPDHDENSTAIVNSTAAQRLTASMRSRPFSDGATASTGAEQRSELFTKLLSPGPSEEITAAWISKELLRGLLSCTARGGLRYEIRIALYRFCKFCAACPILEVTALARTVETWHGPIIRAIETGLTNARSEGYNRIVKHVGRIAFGLRNPDNQRRRVWWACTCRSRRSTPSRH